MKHKIISLLIIILPVSDLNASFRSDIYNAYINNRMEQWKTTIDRMNEIKNKSNELILELVNYQYGYIGYCLGYKRRDEGKNYFVLARKNIEILEKKDYKLSMVHSYKSAFCFFRIILNRITAPVNGIKSFDHAKSAVELDNENYLGYVQLGNTEFYMPSAFGGSKKDTLKYYLKAKELLEQVPGNTDDNWNYLQLLVVIGQTFTYLHDYSNAAAVFEKILKLEPGFLYVKDELFPKLLQKMESGPKS